MFCKLAPKHISIAVSYSLGTEIIFANTPCIPFPSSFIFSQSSNSDFTLLIYPSFSFSVSTKKLYLDCFILISFVLFTICKSYSLILLSISCFLLSISSIAFNILFLSASILLKLWAISSLFILVLSSSNIWLSISCSICFCLFSAFSMFAVCVLICDCNSYFLSVFSSTCFFSFSISSSLLLNFSVNFFSSSSFSFNSFSNFSLFCFKLSFLDCFCSISCFKFSIFSSNSTISFWYSFEFSMLFEILVSATFILEFSFSISFSLSNPIFCISSILVVISSMLSFNSSFKILIFSNFPSSWFKVEFIISSSLVNSSKDCLYLSMLYKNNPTSIFFSSSFKFKYFLALSDCCCKGSKFPSISVNISFILNKLSLVCSNFFSVSSFLALYFTIPAASSNICLLSSDLLLNISSIFPWPIIEYPSLPIPVSINSSTISFNLHGTLLI